MCFIISLISCLPGGMVDGLRAWYGQISHLQSLLPLKTFVIAQTVDLCFANDSCEVNYQVGKSVHKAFGWLVSHLRHKWTALPKVLPFDQHLCIVIQDVPHGVEKREL